MFFKLFPNVLIKKIIIEDRNTKGPSLSPLSKKMAMHRASMETSQKIAQSQNNHSFYQKSTMNYPVIPNEFKVSWN